MGLNYFDRAGQPITSTEWSRLLSADLEACSIARNDFAGPDGPVRVSTMWLGLDHSFDDGPPLIFKTMISGGWLDGEMVRYSTEADARAGHAELLAKAQAS